MAVALGLGCSSVRGGCAEVLQRKTFAQICEAPLTDADAKLAQSLSEEDLKKVVEKASCDMLPDGLEEVSGRAVGSQVGGETKHQRLFKRIKDPHTAID